MLQSHNVSVRVIDDESEFLALQPEWEDLFLRQEQRCCEQDFAWCWAAWKMVAQPQRRKLHIIVGEREGLAVLILPLVWERVGPVRIAYWLGGEYEACADVLVDPREAAESIIKIAWRSVEARFDLLRLSAVRADARILPFVEGRIDVDWKKAPYIDCREWHDWDGFLQSRSGHFRYDLRNALRSLQKRGEVQFVVVDEETKRHETIEWMFLNKLDWIARNTKGSAGFSCLEPLFQEFTRQSLRQGRLFLLELRVGSELVAAELSISDGRCFELLMVSWSYPWRDCGPGRVVALESVRLAFEQKVEKIELGAGIDSFKARIADAHSEMALGLAVPVTPLGYVLVRSKPLLRIFRRGLAAVSTVALSPVGMAGKGRLSWIPRLHRPSADAKDVP